MMMSRHLGIDESPNRYCSRITLVLYRKRTAPQFRLASTSEVHFRYSRQKEAARGCGGRGVFYIDEHQQQAFCQSPRLRLLFKLDFFPNTGLLNLTLRHHRESAPKYLK